MAEIKICGVNDAGFAREAERLGADYLGLILAEGSPRQVTAAQAKAITGSLAGKAKPVGVYTRFPDLAEAREAGFKVIQLHYLASAEEVKAVKAAGFECWTLAGGAAADAIIFDSSHGNGETALRRTAGVRTVLAGGINAGNAAAALKSGADIIDASGSLETAPGIKSVERLREFMLAIKSGI